MSTCAYCRCSTDRQMQKNGTISQEHVIRQWLEREGVEIPDALWFKERKGVSGRRLKGRLAMASLMKAIQDGKVTRVVAYSFVRMFRSVQDAAQYIPVSIEHGVQTVCVSDGFTIDPGNPMSKAFAYMAALFGELQAQSISENVSAGIQAKLAGGGTHGPAPKFTDSALAALLAEPEQSYAALGRKYGVSPHTVRKALRR